MGQVSYPPTFGADTEGPERTMTERLLYTINDAAKVLGVGRTKFYELLDAGHIATVTIGRRRLVPAEDLVAYVDRLRSERTSAQ